MAMPQTGGSFLEVISHLLYTEMYSIKSSYLFAALAYTSLGIFEAVIIIHTRFVSVNTIVCYLTGALVALNQVMLSLFQTEPETGFIEVFSVAFIANVSYLLMCLLFTRNRHPVLVAGTFLALYSAFMYALYCGSFAVPNVWDFLVIVQLCVTTAHNFMPFDSLMAALNARGRKYPSQWLPLLTGLAYCLTGGLYRHENLQYLMTPADALGIAVNLFGLVVELYHAFF